MSAKRKNIIVSVKNNLSALGSLHKGKRKPSYHANNVQGAAKINLLSEYMHMSHLVEEQVGRVKI